MATNPYSYGSLGQRWTVGEPTSKSLLDVSRVKADANRWTLEELVVDPDDTANFVLTAPGLNIDSNTLYVDSAYNTVGFRLSNPNDYAFDGTPNWVASGGSGNASVIIVSGTTSIGYLSFADGTTGTDRYSGNIQYNHGTNTMSFRTNGGVEAMTINSAQDLAVDTDTLFVDASADRVGINTSSADASLHIEGSLVSDLVKVEDTGADSNPNIQIANDARAYNLQVVGARSDAFEIWDRTAGATRLSISTSGNITFNGDLAVNTSTLKVDTANNRVGIKNAGPSYPLDIGYTAGINQVAWRGSSNEIGFLTYGSSTDAGAVQLSSGGAAKILFDAAGNSYINTGSNFGVGTASPTTKLHVSGASSASALRLDETTSSANSYLGYIDTSGNFGIDVNGGGYLRFAVGGAERARIDSSGNLLIGYTSSNGSYKLQVNSQIFATNATIATSDGRYKEDVQTLSNATDLVSRLNPVQFKWKAHEIHNLDVGKTDVGFIAQEVQEVLSDTDYSDSVVVTNKTDDEEYLGLGETKLIPLLTAALQEAITKIETLETKVAALEAA